MTATGTLRRHLDDIRLPYLQIGDYETIVRMESVSLSFRDNYDGTLFARGTKRLSPADAIALVRGRTAVMATSVDGDGVGNCECGACGRTVGQRYGYCPWCGAKFIEIRREYRG